MAALASRKRVRKSSVYLRCPFKAQMLLSYGSEYRSNVRIDSSDVSQRAVCIFSGSPSVAEKTLSVMSSAF